MSKSDKIRRLLARGLKIKEIAKQTGATVNLVHQVKWQAERKKKAQPERSHNPKVVKAEKKYIKKVKAAFKSPRSKLIQSVFQTVKGIEPIQKQRLSSSESLLAELKAVEKKHDPVNNPPHYTDGGVDTLTYIEAKDLNYRLGNVIKYVSRCGKKLDSNPVQDLEKALFYLKREIDVRKSA